MVQLSTVAFIPVTPTQVPVGRPSGLLRYPGLMCIRLG